MQISEYQTKNLIHYYNDNTFIVYLIFTSTFYFSSLCATKISVETPILLSVIKSDLRADSHNITVG